MTQRTLILLAALMALSGSGQAKAAEAHSYEQCQAAAGGEDPRLRACIDAEQERRDTALNQVYKRLIAVLDQDRAVKLKEAERAWITFRDKECDFLGSSEEGGSLALIIQGQCQIDLTKARTAQLQRSAKEEGAAAGDKAH